MSPSQYELSVDFGETTSATVMQYSDLAAKPVNVSGGEFSRRFKINQEVVLPFLNKVKLFEFKENGNIKKVNLSFLLDSYVLVFSILTLLVTICYVYKNHPLTEFALSVFSVLNFALTFIYLNYF